ncbi:cation:dicarboxylase symporter family transporter [Pseudokineococcus marinus]|uniref:Cation:dicarboxylase symporter family transporter n=1 Tax=Pseudokineococcus marinus TaxID=351215 RepID=A0A849BGV4_9ACTN|nr:cation:dicarboxylase symporter family transporter [Pseudokineococcus marinus]NNH22340.1 cation:dicarboxylase symporter family transporter [Pseudokineococcus marinus]
MATQPPPVDRQQTPTAAPAGRDRTHWLYIAVIVAVVLGATVGLAFPDTGVALKPIGTGFVDLVKMMISPVIFCTIVLGIGSIRAAAQVGKVGGLALVYFLGMSTFALAIGLVVGNIVQPGAGIDYPNPGYEVQDTGEEGEGGTLGFVLSIIPTTLVSPLTGDSVLSTLFVAILIGFAVQALGSTGQAALRGIAVFQKVVFKVLAMIMWVAPVGAFGAIAGVTGETGWDAIRGLLLVMLAFYVTCLIFVFGVLGTLLRVVTGLSVFSLLRYLGRELLLIVSTSSSETALPRLIAKMEHAGVDRSVVGITVPVGYSFNLDGTAIYLTMASLFIAEATGAPFSIGEQVSLLVFMIIASKGAAGVTGAGLATLAGGLQSHRPELVDGVGLIVGIDRFMSEARALTNFSGNAIATLLIGHWTKALDRDRVRRVLAGDDPFDERTMVDDHGPTTTAPSADPVAVTNARTPEAGTPSDLESSGRR